MKRRRQPKTTPRSEPKLRSSTPPAGAERPARPRRLRAALVMLAVLAAAAVMAVIYHRGNEPPASPSLGSSLAESADAGAQRCQPCHAEIYESYQQVSMAQTLSRATPQNVIEDYTRNNRFVHKASDRHYEMTQRDGKFYQRRYQLDKDGNPTSIFEREAHYIIGSGRHARSYLHRSENGELTQLPISWYTQENSWGMSPGYDKPKHFDFSRRIDHGCMFCHNAYFPVPQASDAYGAEPRFPAALPTGIDCQRCHGAGNAHIEKASSGKASEQEIRAAIMNPARLDTPRQMDVCLQCHLETTSAELPHALKRFGRTAYSYQPGEPLTDYIVHFDHAPGAGRGGKFEFVGASYRLDQSACFLKSEGSLTCTTCHDPHHTPPAQEAAAYFRERCVACHAPGSPLQPPAQAHPDAAASDCRSCHMPRRRTEDVVHVTITDHLIQRPSANRSLLAPIAENHEPYRGDLVLYYPRELPSPEQEMYRGMALALQGADRPRGIALLEKGIAAAGTSAPVEAFVELAGAHFADGKADAAARQYRKALEKEPGLSKARYNLGLALEQLGDRDGALRELDQVARERPDFPEVRDALGNLLMRMGRAEQASSHYAAAVRLRELFPEAHNNLGMLYAQQGDVDKGIDHLRRALAAEPAFAEAHNNLGQVLALQGKPDAAQEHLRKALALDPKYTEAFYNLGRLLHAQGKHAQAVEQYRAALKIDPRFAPAHMSLGVAFGEQGQVEAAIEQFQQVLRLRPGDPEAQKNLEIALESRSQAGR